MHQTIEPSILYFGTPVVLVSTRNEDGSANLAPISSAFWLGWRCVIGVGSGSQTSRNLLRERSCVLNLPSMHEVAAVDRLALTTGRDPVPAHKAQRGYRHVADKFAQAGFTPQAAQCVSAPRVQECPVQLEAVLQATHGLADDHPHLKGGATCFELRVLRVHVAPALQMAGAPDRIDPDRWRPLIMSFQHFYGLGPALQDSRLAQIPERSYRSPEVDAARLAPTL